MQKTSLTEAGKGHLVEYLNSAIERATDLKQRASINTDADMAQMKLQRLLDDLEKVRLMLFIEFGPEVPSNSFKTTHDAPQQLTY